ncbi:MAG TPA: hypothetical protein PLE82_07295 [Saccharofermentans sp.]|nr:hypothetical protein [Saccharofermentans sp.]
MSRIGRMPITIPAGVEVKLNGQHITVKGAQSTLGMTSILIFLFQLMEISLKLRDLQMRRNTDLYMV